MREPTPFGRASASCPGTMVIRHQLLRTFALALEDGEPAFPSRNSGAITVRRPMATPMPSSARMTARCTGGPLVARITARNHVSSIGTARSAILAVGPCLIPSCHNCRKDGVDWRESRPIWRAGNASHGMGWPRTKFWARKEERQVEPGDLPPFHVRSCRPNLPHPPRRQHRGLFEHSARRLVLRVGRAAVLRWDPLDQAAQDWRGRCREASSRS